VLATVGIPALSTFPHDPVILRGVMLLIAMGYAGIGVAMLLDRLPRAVRAIKIVRYFAQFSADLRFVLLSRALWPPLSYSLANQIGIVVVVYVLGRGLGIPLDFSICLVIVPLANLVQALPVSIGGWGVRESFFVFAFGASGVAAPDALALSVLYGLLNTVVSLPGGVFWLVHGRKTSDERSESQFMQSDDQVGEADESEMTAAAHAVPTISFVVPCYNEAGNIGQTIDAIARANALAEINRYEIVVVDDCSRDGTGELVERLAADDARIRLVTNAINLGFGGAYKEGVKRAHGAYLIMVPGDNAFPADSIARILLKMGKADIVVSYFAQPSARHLSRRIISRAYTTLMNALFALRLPYYNGPALHAAKLLRRIEIKTDGFAFQAEALIKLIKAGATYVTVPVEVVERTEGRSTALRPKNIYRVATTLPRLWLEVRRSNPAAQAAVREYRSEPARMLPAGE
jgi:hypothetical protein